MQKIYNLEERTAKFDEKIIDFSKKLPKNLIINPLISQLVRSATSIGANYCEADCAETKKILNIKLAFAKKNPEKQNTG